MMPNPNQITEVVRQALAAGPADSRSDDARSRQAQLSFSAMLAAVQSGCQCEACQLLREAVDTMRVRPKQETTAHGPIDNPQTYP
jgi:hypothetical protein